MINLVPLDEGLNSFLQSELMQKWHRIALQCGFRDSGPPPGAEVVLPFLKRAGIEDLKQIQALLDNLDEAKGRYFLRKSRSFSSDANFEAAPAYLLQHFVYLLLPEKEDLLHHDELGALSESLQKAKHATLAREAKNGPTDFSFEALRIEKFWLRNYRGYKDYTLSPLGSRLTVLIGDNGSGKTALLDAVKSLLAAYLYAHPSSENHFQKIDHLLQHDKDLHQKIYFLGQTPTLETADHIELFSEGFSNDKSVHWQTETDPFGSNITPIGSDFWLWHEQVAKGIPVCLPIIAFYGSARLFEQLIKTPDINGPSSRLKGYINCLNSRFDLKGLMQWFRQNELAVLQKGETRHVLECVRQAIVSMVPDAVGARWDMDFDELHILFDSGERQISMPFSRLSDGYRNLIGIAGDIAWRMALLNPQLETEAINLTAGIVLIDEIDLHLHPNWQRIVIAQLLKTFPEVQFITTTHSPFIIQSLYDLPEREQVVLWDVSKQRPVDLSSKSVEDIAEDYQGVELPQQSQRFLDKERVAKEFYRLLQEEPNNYEEKSRLKAQLDELMRPYSDDPAFQAALIFHRNRFPWARDEDIDEAANAAN